MVPFTKEISSLNGRILLTGQKGTPFSSSSLSPPHVDPLGTQNIQKVLVEALARASKAKLLIIDEAINEELPMKEKKSDKKDVWLT